MIKILNGLKELYPTQKITMWCKEDKGKLYLDDDVIMTFNPELITKQLLMAAIKETEEKVLADTIKIFSEYLDKKLEIKRKKRRITLTESQIKFAFTKTKSINQCSRYLNVTVNTLNRYCGMYNIDTKPYNNKAGFGTNKGHTTWFKKVPFEDIFDNKFPTYNRTKLKNRMIKEGLKEERCEMCGYQEKRKIDLTVPLLIDFMDGNKLNYGLYNLRLVCYNCFYMINTIGNRKGMEILDDFIVSRSGIEERWL